ncbi:uncharacterized protein PAC_06199 [Phialocephala subalpina]|uniref:Uncharacterized protein n=1 Tax=Phialocephala subalpina TaxID=576137 RepID=A0A1L7WU53_9HELO|nr:uncharacterized protein PAC_06199 [Phialocephala subalpina]
MSQPQPNAPTGNKPKSVKPAGARATTKDGVDKLILKLDKVIDGDRSNLDIASFSKPHPRNLDPVIYVSHAYEFCPMGRVREGLNAAGKDAAWTTRPRGLTEKSENPLRDNVQMGALARIEFLFEKVLTKKQAVRFVPACTPKGTEFSSATELFVNSFKHACGNAKSDFNKRMLMWVIATVKHRDFKEIVEKPLDQHYAWWRSRLRLATPADEIEITGKKIVIWLLDAWSDCIDFPFIFCTDHIGIQERGPAWQSKLDMQNWLFYFCGFMAVQCFLLAVDHDDREEFQHYWTIYLTQWGASNKGIKKMMPKSSDDIAVQSVLLRSRDIPIAEPAFPVKQIQ